MNYLNASFIILLIIVFITLNLKINKRNKKLLRLENDINKKIELKFKSYHYFFKSVKYLYEHLTPKTLSVYLYKYNDNLKNTILKFVYQLKRNNSDTDVIFIGENDNIPITNIETLTKLYYDNNNIMIIDDIEKLSKYDNGLYEYLLKKEMYKLYIVNIYDFDSYINKEKSKPIGFFALTYKNKTLNQTEEDILITQSMKMSFILNDILK